MKMLMRFRELSSESIDHRYLPKVAKLFADFKFVVVLCQEWPDFVIFCSHKRGLNLISTKGEV